MVINDTLINEFGIVVCGMNRLDGTSKTGKEYHLVQFYGLKNPEGIGSEKCVGFMTVDDLTISLDDFNKFIPDVQLGDEVLFGFSKANSYVDDSGKVRSYQRLVFAQILSQKKK